MFFLQVTVYFVMSRPLSHVMKNMYLMDKISVSAILIE